MKHYFRSFAACCCLLLLLSSLSACKKSGVNQNLNPNNQTQIDFMSAKSGSFWLYGSRSGVSYTRFARGKDSIKNGLKYAYYERREDTTGNFTPEYFGKNNQYYITLIDLDGTQNNYLEYVFWKDSAQQGDSWTNTGSVTYPGLGNIDLVTESSEPQASLTMSIGPNTYTGVVHVHSDIRAAAFNIPIGTLDLWFVKGLGVIREEAHINVLNAFSREHTDSLLSYHIEP